MQELQKWLASSSRSVRFLFSACAHDMVCHS
jgi:hypothetical protein